MRLMTKQYTPRDLRQACAMPREDAVWFMEHCAEAWEADRQRLEEAEKALVDDDEGVTEAHKLLSMLRGRVRAALAAGEET